MNRKFLASLLGASLLMGTFFLSQSPVRADDPTWTFHVRVFDRNGVEKGGFDADSFPEPEEVEGGMDTGDTAACTADATDPATGAVVASGVFVWALTCN